MPTTYVFAEPAVSSLLSRVMKFHHPKLHEAGVRVGVLMARNPDGPAVKHAGYAALAKIKPVALKDRVAKSYDAELIIDEREYESLRDEQREALLDHELSHLGTIPVPPEELKLLREEDSQAPEWKVDDLGRPKLRSVPGNWNAGDGFKDVVARHGEDAIEFENLRRAYEFADRARRAGPDEASGAA